MKTQFEKNSGVMLQKTKHAKFVFLVLCLFLASRNFAQDTFTLRDGSEMNGKVTEIGEMDIKYIPADNPNTKRVISKSEVFMIKFENGTKEIFEQETSPQPYHPAAQPVYASDNRYDLDTSDFAKLRQKKFSGPRVGYTFLGEGTSADYLESVNKRAQFVQFGWQFETVLFTAGNTSGLIEFVPLIGGFEQGMFIPSLNILLGIRGGDKYPFEFAIGPNFSVGRNYQQDIVGTVGCVFAIGTSFRKDKINFPVSIAFVPSVGSQHDVSDTKGKVTSQNFETGYRISILVGFNTRKH